MEEMNGMGERICMGCMESYDEQYDICPHCGYKTDTPPKEAYHLVPGEILHKRYIVGKVLGYGGFGVTYLGFDALLKMKIAIKEYLPGEFGTRAPGTKEVTIFSGDREEQFKNGVVKFTDEAKRLAQFNDTPGVVSVFDTFMENNTAYIVMEYLEGETLKKMLEREGKMTIEAALDMMLPIISALKEVHKKGILHRDISPDNIFITNKGEVKLLDFGAARYATTTHSKSLSVIVKPGYAPQEQYRSRGDQGTWTDVYACAATLYRMITGVTPDDAMERGTKDTLVPPSKLGINIPQNKENAIMNALNLEIQDRTPDMDSLEADLTTEGEVRRNKIKLRKMDIGRWPLWLKLTVGGIGAAIVTFAILLLTGVINWGSLNIFDKRTKVYVPNVLNYTETDAERMVSDKNLTFVIAGKEESEVIPNGMVLSQNIPSGAEVEEGMRFEVVISAGRGTSHMPDVTGLSADEAKQMLEELGFQVVFSDGESEVAEGYIYEQQYKEGQAVEKGTEITLHVSKGDSSYNAESETKIPKVAGKSWEKARSLAAKRKVYVYKASTKEDEKVTKGTVISQDTKAGTKVPEGTVFGVDVSLGIKKTYVPDVEYKSLEEATRLLNEAKLNVEIEYQESDKVAKDHVISQSIAKDTEVDAWTTITIYVSLANDKINSAKEYENQEPEVKPTATPKPDDKEASDGNDNPQKPQNTAKPTATPKPDDKETSGKNDNPKKPQPTEKPQEPVMEPIDTSIAVPNLIGKTEQTAKDELLQIGLSVGSITRMYSSGNSTGEILNQGIAASTKVDVGTSINLIVCDNSMKTQYRYRDAEIVTKTTNSETPPNGYSYTGENRFVRYDYGEWGNNWSGWSPNYVEESDTRQVLKEAGAIFGRYLNPDTYEQNDTDGGGYYSRKEELYLPWSYMDSLGNKYGTGTLVYDMISSKTGYEARFYRRVHWTDTWTWEGTLYSYRSRSKTPVYEYTHEKMIYGAWSQWSDTKPSTSANREIETQEVPIYDAY